MNQRLVAACIAVPAIIGLLLVALFNRLPYATYSPGGTVDVLGSDSNDAEVIQVDGHQVYRDDGQLRMTTVRVSPAQLPDERGIGLVSLLGTWFDPDNAVYPYGAVHEEGETQQSNQQQGAVQMATSQDAAVEVALEEMGIEVPQVLKVAALTEGLPAQGKLQVGDVLLTINGQTFTDQDALVKLINDAPQGKPVEVGIERQGTKQTISITPVVDDAGVQRIGITPGFDFDFPFEVKINISPEIGGPSAGLIFSLAVYDTLTPGSLTGGRAIAGTGEIRPDGSVGPIGGIQQKIAGARGDGAELFLVPIDNCDDALQADNGDMRLMMAQDMHDVRLALEDYAADPDADLPSCEDADAILAEAS
ncbi:PDZ domain-containing protein [Nocardioides marinquilinus]|uniref:PDZ domain-containing protein n=1 Tax=Nocardioides marinquilinus TaxID=1210400 RepID=A0ABP9Q3S3_9ACTN